MTNIASALTSSVRSGVPEAIPMASSVPLWYASMAACILAVVLAWVFACRAKRSRRSTAKQVRVIIAATLLIPLSGLAAIALNMGSFFVAISELPPEWKVGVWSVVSLGCAYYCRLIALTFIAAAISVIACVTVPRVDLGRDA